MPVAVPEPTHHHLPGWVRRDFARVRRPLGLLLAELEGEFADQLRRRLDEVTTAISAGRFSAAWQYPEVVAEGRRLLAEQRRLRAERERQARTLEDARRRLLQRVGDVEGLVGQETLVRLQRTVRSASDLSALRSAESDVERVLEQARTAWSKRREREIERVRARIRGVARGEGGEGTTTLPWQEVLRRALSETAVEGAGVGPEGTEGEG